MNHAEQVKKLVVELRSAAYMEGNTAFESMKLFAAIDAMQAELDELERQKEVWIKQCWMRDEEISGLRGLLDDAEAKLVARDAEIERLRKDAERYEFLREDFSVMSLNIDGNHAWAYRRNFSLRGATLDEAIDAALSEEVKGGV